MEPCTLPESFVNDFGVALEAIISASIIYGVALALFLALLAYTFHQVLSVFVTPRLIPALRRARRRRALSHAKTAKQGTPV